jgi:hypothetical protein
MTAPFPRSRRHDSSRRARVIRLPLLAAAVSVVILCVAGAAQRAQQAQSSKESTAPNHALQSQVLAVAPADAKGATALADQPRQQLAAETARLLQLAAELKADVEKTPKDMLSLDVIRKADEVAKQAHMLRDALKTTGSAK